MKPKKMGWLRYLNVIIQKKYLAVVLIVILMVSDFFSLMSLFSPEETDIPYQYSILFCLILALCLEGLPTLLGTAVSIQKSSTTFKRDDKEFAKTLAVVSGSGTIIAFCVVITLRILNIIESDEFALFVAKESQGQFAIDVFLCVYPILTSIFAFGLSWLAFRPDNEKTLGIQTDKSFMEYTNANLAYIIARQKFQNARTALWTSIKDNTMDHDDMMPQKLDVFRQVSFSRIRSKLIENSLEEFPKQLERYDAAVMSSLRSYIFEMSGHSTIPLSISGLNIEEEISKFDSLQSKDSEAWNLQRSQADLQSELEKILDNAIVVAQVKTTTLPYSVEGDGVL